MRDILKDDFIISSVDEIIKDAKNGKMFILMDNEDRENEGDLVVLADKVSDEAINMMIKYGSGIVCLAITNDISNRLGLELMCRNNVGDDHTAFTTSIDARYGISTGVSSKDRVHTIKTAINYNTSIDDLVTPGHVFPIIAKKGGVLLRPGHTEASVDIACLAGSIPAAVICELMNSDGTMSRLSDIKKFLYI